MIKHCPPRVQEKFVKNFTLSEMIQEIPFIRLKKFPQTGRAPPKIRAAGDAKGVFNMHPPPFIAGKSIPHHAPRPLDGRGCPKDG
jgi:hypothetical protein